jgi:gas vesicle protein
MLGDGNNLFTPQRCNRCAPWHFSKHWANTPEFLTSPTTGIRVIEGAITIMKRITSLAMAVTALIGLGLSGCDKKTSDDLKQKAQDAKETVETKAKEAKEAADKQIEKAKQKMKEFGEKAKDATQDAIDKTKDAAGAAADKLKEATGRSPEPASPTPTP